MLSSCLVTSVGIGYSDLIDETLKDIPHFINKIFIINDSGLALSLQIKEKRIEILENHENIGLSKSLEKWSTEFYKYDLIFRLDIGDKSKPQRFLKQYEFMKINTNYVLCGFETQFILPDKTQKKSFYSMKSFLIKLILLFRNCIVHGSICIRSKALKNAGGYSGDFKSCQDIDMYLRLMRMGKFAILKGPFHQHKFHNKISTTFLKQKENYKITANIRYKVAKSNIYLSPFFLISSVYYYLKYLIKVG